MVEDAAEGRSTPSGGLKGCGFCCVGFLCHAPGFSPWRRLLLFLWLKMHDYNLRKDERSRVAAKIEQKANANAEKLMLPASLLTLSC
ncbi:MAG: hypothetical protein IPM06_17990 [Rhizobiales bacterium]|nr:hypothetical protein [Hyphomicrobiales bacterium]